MKNYYSETCLENGDFSLFTNYNFNNLTNSTSEGLDLVCRRDASLLFLLLMLGTVWLAVSLYNFNKT